MNLSEWEKMSKASRVAFIEAERQNDPLALRIRLLAEDAVALLVESNSVDLRDETITVVQHPSRDWTIARLWSVSRSPRGTLMPRPSGALPDECVDTRFCQYFDGVMFMGFEVWHWHIHELEQRYRRTRHALLINILQWSEHDANVWVNDLEKRLGRGRFTRWKDLKNGTSDYLTSFHEPPLRPMVPMLFKHLFGANQQVMDEVDLENALYEALMHENSQFSTHSNEIPNLDWNLARSRLLRWVNCQKAAES